MHLRIRVPDQRHLNDRLPTARRFAAVLGSLGIGLLLAGCGGNGSDTSPEIQEAWNVCQSTSDAQDFSGAYDGIKPDGASLPILLDGVTVTESPGSNSITFRGTVENVRFQCIYNTFAKVAAVDWGS